jgi:hypothetical protein
MRHGLSLGISTLVLNFAWGCGGHLESERSAPATEASAWYEESPEWGPRAHIQAKSIDECSGIVRSRQYPGIDWVHNDSGDAARIFAINARGELVREVAIEGADHVDWEDIAADDHGNLYICDIGNNRSNRRDLAVYVIREPDPHRDRSVTARRRLGFHYPDQVAFPDPARNHDCEAVFWRAGHLYFLSKHRSDTWTRLYRMEDCDPALGEPGGSTVDAGQVLTLIDSLDVGSMVTAADLSPDGSELAVLTYDFLFLCKLPAEGDRFLSDGTACRLLFEARQSEAISHEGSVLRVTNEQGEIHLLARDAVTAAGQACAGGGATRPFVPSPSAEEEAQATIRCQGDDLRVELSWPAGRLRGKDPLLVMVAAWGSRSDRRTRPGPGDQVWGVYATASGLEASKMDPRSDIPPKLALAQRGDRIEGSITLTAGGEEARERAACPVAALNLNLFVPSGGEWRWGGEWSMRAPVNPFLWGELVAAP